MYKRIEINYYKRKGTFMSYQTALTIYNVIQEIDSRRYLLPSIQREFVWGTEQIEKLFDSLMRDYPIHSFLFWKVPKEKTNEFKFYEFLREYHQKNNRHNLKADTKGSGDIMAVLDGQQRLTSLYIALKGSYAYKLSYKRRDNPAAYPKRKLYLNLLSPSERSDLEYDFCFLTDTEAQKRDEEHFWFLVGDILNIKEQYEVTEYLTDHDLNIVQKKEEKERVKFANRALTKLFNIIHVTPTISYYLEESIELDKVLNIFIRVNSGGTILSYSDLLLSFATAQWEKRDAREEINQFVDEINEIGNGFNISKDFVLKACLVLCDFSDISFKADNFNKTNMLIIENKWENITKAIRAAVQLIASFGFSMENLTSNNVMIPIAYYLQMIGIPENYLSSKKYKEDRILVKKWLVATSLKRVFSFAPDGVLKPIREILKTDNETFPLKKIVQKFRAGNRTLVFSEDEIFDLLFTKCGQSDLIVIMSILYPWADLKNNFHIDHIYPKSLFTKKKLKALGVAEDKIDTYIENVNYIGNLQLLDGISNIEKKDKPFEEWLAQNYKDADSLSDYKQRQLIPDVPPTFPNFLEFLEAREALIKEKLIHELKF